jgi:hypothetical protein
MPVPINIEVSVLVVPIAAGLGDTGAVTGAPGADAAPLFVGEMGTPTGSMDDAKGAAGAIANFSISERTMLPFGPLPGMVDKSIPRCSAIFRAIGEIEMFVMFVMFVESIAIFRALSFPTGSIPPVTGRTTSATVLTQYIR